METPADSRNSRPSNRPASHLEKICDSDLSTKNRRSSNACRRCKSKKIKCHFTLGTTQSTCTPCKKSKSDCVFDVSPDGIPRGAAYIASLESQVQSLASELRLANSKLQLLSNKLPLNSERGDSLAWSENEPENNISLAPTPTNTNKLQSTAGSSIDQATPSHNTAPIPQKPLDSTSEITIFNFLQNFSSASKSSTDEVPELPPVELAENLIEAAYLHTQARYSLVDWVQVRKWHQQRELYCYSYREGNLEFQTAAYFIWIVYALGAQLNSTTSHLSNTYYCHAHSCLHAVLAQQNLATIQALLTISQYHLRATGGPSVWHLVGVALRLCIELGYHRKPLKNPTKDGQDPYTLELQKRFFWGTYCFDRMLAMAFKRPFGIHDLDITTDLPINVDLTCTDTNEIRFLQSSQMRGDNSSDGMVTSMTACLQHLQIYRLRSNIITRLTGLGALTPAFDAMEFFSELAQWRQKTRSKPPSMKVPHQSEERVDAVYFEAVLLLVRPIVAQTTIDPDLLRKCAELSADACKNTRAVSLSPETQTSGGITVFNSFRCGITLLQCLVVQPTALSMRETHKALSSCSSALVVYTQKNSAAAPFLQLFDRLSDHFLSGSDRTDAFQPNLETLRSILQKIASSGPSDTLELFRSFSEDQLSQDSQVHAASNSQSTDVVRQYDPFWGLGSFSTIDMDLTMPYEMFSDIPYLQDTSLQSMADFWTGMGQYLGFY